jgi:hypothetical protein
MRIVCREEGIAEEQGLHEKDYQKDSKDEAQFLKLPDHQIVNYPRSRTGASKAPKTILLARSDHLGSFDMGCIF